MNGEQEVTLSFSTLLFCATIKLFTTIVNSNIDYHYLPSGFFLLIIIMICNPLNFKHTRRVVSDFSI